MRRTWEGHYLDGRSATRQPVTIQPLRAALHFTTADDRRFTWPYAKIRQTQGNYEGEHVRLEYGEQIPEVLVVTDATFLTALHEIAPELTTQMHDPSRRNARIRLTAYAAIGAVGVCAALYLWGIPMLVAIATPMVPVSWEKQLGATVVDRLAPEDARCTDPGRLAVIQALVTRLSRAAPENPYEISLYVVDVPQVNAFAAPGGYVVIFRGLLEATERPEQLAGVLAHEVQHVYKRHTTRAILEHASTSLLLAAVAGDVSGAMAYGMEVARQMGTLRYSRGHEEEADTEGMKLMIAAGIDPMGMAEFFEILHKTHPNMPDSLQYLSSHPSTQARIEELKRLAQSSSQDEAPLLQGMDWSHITSICKAKPSSPTPSS